ncbi:MAG: DUF3307 domain-containing protein [Verrucomicrobiales bacterium]
MQEFLGIENLADPARVLALFFAFAIVHSLADFPLQGTFLAINKRRPKDGASAWNGGDVGPHAWVVCLTAHSLIHAGAVWLIGGRIELALAEFALHWLIDFTRNEERISFVADQVLHLSCKAAYAAILVYGM